MKVLLATPRITHGGPANLYRALAAWLDQRGHTVLVAYDATLNSSVDLGGNITCRALAPRGRHWLARLPIVPMWRLLRAERPDIVLASMSMTRTVAIARCFMRRPPVFVARPANQPAKHPRRSAVNVGRLLQQWSVRRANAAVAQSRGIEQWVRNIGCMCPVRVIGNPVTMEPPDSSRPVALQGSPAVVAVGRLHRQKGYDYLLPAFAKAKVTLTHAHLHILGDGSQDELRALAHGLGIDSHVTFHGHVTNVRDYLQAADMFATTSRHEGFQNALLEAQSMGVPTVATDSVVAATEILATTKGGVLAKQGDVDSIADGLCTVAANLSTYDRVSIAARTRATWSIDAVGQAYEDLFTSLCSTD